MKASHLLAFLGGAAVGAAIALLLAPESGEKTRQKIADKLSEKGINLDKEALAALVDKVRSKLKENFTDSDLDSAINDSLKDN